MTPSSRGCGTAPEKRTRVIDECESVRSMLSSSDGPRVRMRFATAVSRSRPAL
ncbi:MAG TPA: hypothetical protein VHF89_11415 [Solirubrobacteraceae bacterium]|nr:hypothetical protein [Solirubrobacteraceae bacterium]